MADKLIVETTHLKEAVDQGRYPHSADAKIVEESTSPEQRHAWIIAGTSVTALA